MLISVKNKRHIAANACFLEERIRCPALLKTLKNDPRDLASLLERWENLLTGRIYSGSLAKRLSIDGISPAKVKPLLGNLDWMPRKKLPEWIESLEEFFKLLPLDYEKAVKKLPSCVILKNDPVPFEEIWLPCLIFAAEKIERESGGLLKEHMTEKAFGQFLRSLLKTLSASFSLPLLSAFDMKRNRGIFFISFPRGGRKFYKAFVHEMLNGKWLDFCLKYPLVPRLCVSLLNDKASYFSSFLNHLEKDSEKIKKVFCRGKKTGRVAEADFSISDPHKGHRTVASIRFENGMRLIYKPRSSEIDSCWEKVLSWCSSKLPGMDFIVPKRLEGKGYSWVEYIENRPLKKPEEAAAFYYRCGGVLALIHAMGGNDFHQENMIACGEYPALIDLETIMCPLVRPFDYDTMTGDEKKELFRIDEENILRSSFLPVWTPVNKEISRDYGALSPNDNAIYHSAEIVDINTDRMSRKNVKHKTLPSCNVPHFNGKLIAVRKHARELIEGFKDLYRVISEHRGEFINGPLRAFASAPLRFLPRSTQIYIEMMERLYSPRILRNGALYSIEIEALAMPFINSGVPEKKLKRLWKIFELERDSIRFLDVPVFEGRAGEQDVMGGDGNVVKNYFLSSAIREAGRITAGFSPENMELQAELIKASISCRYPEKENKRAVPSAPGKIFSGEIPDENFFIKAAAAIASEIDSKKMFLSGYPRWLALKSDPVTHNMNIGSVDAFMYEGAAGIGLFLSAYTHLAEDGTYRALAKNCFKRLSDMIDDSENADMKRWMPLGYPGNFCGGACAAWSAGDYLNDISLKKLALKIMGSFDKSLFREDASGDLMTGVSGTLLAFLDFYEKTGEKCFLEQALRAGNFIMEERMAFGKRKLWIPFFAVQPLTGFGHGMAGYAAALLKLWKFSGREKFLSAALDAIGYENENYKPDYMNWTDFRMNQLAPSKTGKTFMAGWCSGAPGIGIGRLSCREILKRKSIEKDIENVINFVRFSEIQTNTPDHLCCGNCAKIDFLIEASLKLKRPELFDDAKRLLAFVIRRAEKKGSYTFRADGTNAVFSPGLFTGLSGIGMTALRLCNPVKIKTVLVPGN